MSACQNPPCAEVGPFRYCPIKDCGWMEDQPAPTGVELIAAERQRQMTVVGWTPEHDDEHDSGELNSAATCYLKVEHMQVGLGASAVEAREVPRIWPWGAVSWKPSSDPIRNLVKAGALIAAEIDRLQRKATDGA